MDDIIAAFQMSQLTFKEFEWLAQVLMVNWVVEKHYKPRLVLPESQ